MNFDVLIIGGGMVGAAFGCALGDVGIRIGIVDNRAPAAESNDIDPRVSAITLASRYLFENIGAWERFSPQRMCPVEAMQVWEAGNGIRFDAAEIGEACLAYIVENAQIQRALVECLQCCPNVQMLWPAQIQSISIDDARANVALTDGRRLTARLLVGADGADSIVRRFADIGTRKLDMQQKGIVATVRTERPHERIARQHFLPTGPLAFLPLPDAHTCSIVWSADTARADSLTALDDAAFIAELQGAFGGALGRVVSASPRQAFALGLMHSDSYTAHRLALIGDAAHTVHPLAGQGVNLGFLDAAVLAENVLANILRGRDPGTHDALRRYERARKGDNLAMIAVTGGFKYLFGNTLPFVHRVRSAGLDMADRLVPVKRMFMRRAMGLTGVPVLARSRASLRAR